MRGEEVYQFVGSILDSVKKHAVVGSPIPSMLFFLYLSRKSEGISSGIGGAVGATSDSKFGAAFFMVAIKL